MAQVVYYLVFSALLMTIAIPLKLPTDIIWVYGFFVAVGLVFLIRDLARKRNMGPVPESNAELIRGFVDRLDQAGRNAAAVRSQPWFADSVVDLNTAYDRAANDGHFIVTSNSFFVVPVPFFVLPVEAIVKWGFATEAEVLSAFERAQSGSTPSAWTENPKALYELGCMGWRGAAAVARLGLFLEHRRPSPSSLTSGDLPPRT